MTRFEEIGIQHQLCSNSKQDSINKFMRSCDICCNKGLRIYCDKCGIAYIHNKVIDYYYNKQNLEQLRLRELRPVQEF